MTSALLGAQPSEGKSTDSSTQWMMRVVSNALLFSSEELTHPEVIKLDSNGTFVKFVDLSAKMLRAFSSVNSYIDFYGGTQTFLFYYEKR